MPPTLQKILPLLLRAMMSGRVVLQCLTQARHPDRDLLGQ
jgi:hypothetical protein